MYELRTLLAKNTIRLKNIGFASKEDYQDRKFNFGVLKDVLENDGLKLEQKHKKIHDILAQNLFVTKNNFFNKDDQKPDAQQYFQEIFKKLNADPKFNGFKNSIYYSKLLKLNQKNGKTLSADDYVNNLNQAQRDFFKANSAYNIEEIAIYLDDIVKNFADYQPQEYVARILQVFAAYEARKDDISVDKKIAFLQQIIAYSKDQYSSLFESSMQYRLVQELIDDRESFLQNERDYLAKIGLVNEDSLNDYRGLATIQNKMFFEKPKLNIAARVLDIERAPIEEVDVFQQKKQEFNAWKNNVLRFIEQQENIIRAKNNIYFINLFEERFAKIRELLDQDINSQAKINEIVDLFKIENIVYKNSSGAGHAMRDNNISYDFSLAEAREQANNRDKAAGNNKGIFESRFKNSPGDPAAKKDRKARAAKLTYAQIAKICDYYENGDFLSNASDRRYVSDALYIHNNRDYRDQLINDKFLLSKLYKIVTAGEDVIGKDVGFEVSRIDLADEPNHVTAVDNDKLKELYDALTHNDPRVSKILSLQQKLSLNPIQEAHFNEVAKQSDELVSLLNIFLRMGRRVLTVAGNDISASPLNPSKDAAVLKVQKLVDEILDEGFADKKNPAAFKALGGDGLNLAKNTVRKKQIEARLEVTSSCMAALADIQKLYPDFGVHSKFFDIPSPYAPNDLLNIGYNAIYHGKSSKVTLDEQIKALKSALNAIELNHTNDCTNALRNIDEFSLIENLANYFINAVNRDDVFYEDFPDYTDIEIEDVKESLKELRKNKAFGSSDTAYRESLNNTSVLLANFVAEISKYAALKEQTQDNSIAKSNAAFAAVNLSKAANLIDLGHKVHEKFEGGLTAAVDPSMQNAVKELFDPDLKKRIYANEFDDKRIQDLVKVVASGNRQIGDVDIFKEINNIFSDKNLNTLINTYKNGDTLSAEAKSEVVNFLKFRDKLYNALESYYKEADSIHRAGETEKFADYRRLAKLKELKGLMTAIFPEEEYSVTATAGLSKSFSDVSGLTNSGYDRDRQSATLSKALEYYSRNDAKINSVTGTAMAQGFHSIFVDARTGLVEKLGDKTIINNVSVDNGNFAYDDDIKDCFTELWQDVSDKFCKKDGEYIKEYWPANLKLLEYGLSNILAEKQALEKRLKRKVKLDAGLQTKLRNAIDDVINSIDDVNIRNKLESSSYFEFTPERIKDTAETNLFAGDLSFFSDSVHKNYASLARRQDPHASTALPVELLNYVANIGINGKSLDKFYSEEFNKVVINPRHPDLLKKVIFALFDENYLKQKSADISPLSFNQIKEDLVRKSLNGLGSKSEILKHLYEVRSKSLHYPASSDLKNVSTEELSLFADHIFSFVKEIKTRVRSYSDTQSLLSFTNSDRSLASQHAKMFSEGKKPEELKSILNEVLAHPQKFINIDSTDFELNCLYFFLQNTLETLRYPSITIIARIENFEKKLDKDDVDYQLKKSFYRGLCNFVLTDKSADIEAMKYIADRDDLEISDIRHIENFDFLEDLKGEMDKDILYHADLADFLKLHQKGIRTKDGVITGLDVYDDEKAAADLKSRYGDNLENFKRYYQGLRKDFKGGDLIDRMNKSSQKYQELVNQKKNFRNFAKLNNLVVKEADNEKLLLLELDYLGRIQSTGFKLSERGYLALEKKYNSFFGKSLTKLESECNALIKDCRSDKEKYEKIADRISDINIRLADIQHLYDFHNKLLLTTIPEQHTLRKNEFVKKIADKIVEYDKIYKDYSANRFPAEFAEQLLKKIIPYIIEDRLTNLEYKNSLNEIFSSQFITQNIHLVRYSGVDEEKLRQDLRNVEGTINDKFLSPKAELNLRRAKLFLYDASLQQNERLIRNNENYDWSLESAYDYFYSKRAAKNVALNSKKKDFETKTLKEFLILAKDDNYQPNLNDFIIFLDALKVHFPPKNNKITGRDFYNGEVCNIVEFMRSLNNEATKGVQIFDASAGPGKYLLTNLQPIYMKLVNLSKAYPDNGELSLFIKDIENFADGLLGAGTARRSYGNDGGAPVYAAASVDIDYNNPVSKSNFVINISADSDKKMVIRHLRNFILNYKEEDIIAEDKNFSLQKFSEIEAGFLENLVAYDYVTGDVDCEGLRDNILTNILYHDPHANTYNAVGRSAQEKLMALYFTGWLDDEHFCNALEQILNLRVDPKLFLPAVPAVKKDPILALNEYYRNLADLFLANGKDLASLSDMDLYLIHSLPLSRDVLINSRKPSCDDSKKLFAKDGLLERLDCFKKIMKEKERDMKELLTDPSKYKKNQSKIDAIKANHNNILTQEILYFRKNGKLSANYPSSFLFSLPAETFKTDLTNLKFANGSGIAAEAITSEDLTSFFNHAYDQPGSDRIWLNRFLFSQINNINRFDYKTLAKVKYFPSEGFINKNINIDDTRISSLPVIEQIYAKIAHYEINQLNNAVTNKIDVSDKILAEKSLFDKVFKNYLTDISSKKEGFSDLEISYPSKFFTFLLNKLDKRILTKLEEYYKTNLELVQMILDLDSHKKLPMILDRIDLIKDHTDFDKLLFKNILIKINEQIDPYLADNTIKRDKNYDNAKAILTALNEKYAIINPKEKIDEVTEIDKSLYTKNSKGGSKNIHRQYISTESLALIEAIKEVRMAETDGRDLKKILKNPLKAITNAKQSEMIAKNIPISFFTSNKITFADVERARNVYFDQGVRFYNNGYLGYRSLKYLESHKSDVRKLDQHKIFDIIADKALIAEQLEGIRNGKKDSNDLTKSLKTLTDNINKLAPLSAGDATYDVIKADLDSKISEFLRSLKDYAGVTIEYGQYAKFLEAVKDASQPGKIFPKLERIKSSLDPMVAWKTTGLSMNDIRQVSYFYHHPEEIEHIPNRFCDENFKHSNPVSVSLAVMKMMRNAPNFGDYGKIKKLIDLNQTAHEEILLAITGDVDFVIRAKKQEGYVVTDLIEKFTQAWLKKEKSITLDNPKITIKTGFLRNFGKDINSILENNDYTNSLQVSRRIGQGKNPYKDLYRDLELNRFFGKAVFDSGDLNYFKLKEGLIEYKNSHQGKLNKKIEDRLEQAEFLRSLVKRNDSNLSAEEFTQFMQLINTMIKDHAKGRKSIELTDAFADDKVILDFLMHSYRSQIIRNFDQFRKDVNFRDLHKILTHDKTNNYDDLMKSLILASPLHSFFRRENPIGSFIGKGLNYETGSTPQLRQFFVDESICKDEDVKDRINTISKYSRNLMSSRFAEGRSKTSYDSVDTGRNMMTDIDLSELSQVSKMQIRIERLRDLQTMFEKNDKAEDRAIKDLFSSTSSPRGTKSFFGGVVFTTQSQNSDYVIRNINSINNNIMDQISNARKSFSDQLTSVNKDMKNCLADLNKDMKQYVESCFIPKITEIHAGFDKNYDGIKAILNKPRSSTFRSMNKDDRVKAITDDICKKITDPHEKNEIFTEVKELVALNDNIRKFAMQIEVNEGKIAKGHGVKFVDKNNNDTKSSRKLKEILKERENKAKAESDAIDAKKSPSYRAMLAHSNAEDLESKIP